MGLLQTLPAWCIENINNNYLKNIGALPVVLQQCLGEADQLTYLNKKYEFEHQKATEVAM